MLPSDDFTTMPVYDKKKGGAPGLSLSDDLPARYMEMWSRLWRPFEPEQADANAKRE